MSSDNRDTTIDSNRRERGTRWCSERRLGSSLHDCLALAFLPRNSPAWNDRRGTGGKQVEGWIDFHMAKLNCFRGTWSLSRVPARHGGCFSTSNRV